MFDKAERGKASGGDYEDPDGEITYGVQEYEVPVSSKDVFNHNVCR